MQTNISLYTKHRPAQLDEIIGQKHITDTLKHASQNNWFVHAYLFSGNRGTGKTSTARILATLMTCDNPVNGKVCGKCRACTTIPKDASLDVKELDGARNGLVDDVKILIDSARWSPVELSHKIIIIDEVHRLSKGAVSALLKILEEPPAYLTFILCTTEIEKMLDTITSRCQRYNFKRITVKEIAQRLKEIAEKESISADNDALLLLAKLARGSMRDAISSLGQVATLANSEKISTDIVQNCFCISDQHAIINIVKSIIKSDISLLLDQVNDLIVASVNINQIMFEISEIFRSIMLLKAQKGKRDLVDLTDNEIEVLEEIGKSLTSSQLLKLAHVFSNVEKKMSFNINERWIMEATLINCVASLRSNNQ